MPRGLPDVHLTNYDDIFSTQDQRNDEAQKSEVIREIPLSELHPFKDHPFRVIDDEAMDKTVESIRTYGVLTPAIARPLPEGGYELISGHRRHHASMLAGKETMPVIVREMDDDAATILMVDSNLQREELLPSEKAKAYQMKLEAIKHQGVKRNPTFRQVVGKLEAAKLVTDANGDSGRQVQRYIRLNNLIPEVLDMVDQKKISFNPAVELSYLKPEEQKNFVEAYAFGGEVAPSLSQTQRMKRMSQANMCTLEAMCAVMSEDKKMPEDRIVFNSNDLRFYFPKSYSSAQMHDTIIKLLEQWQKRRDRSQSL